MPELLQYISNDYLKPFRLVIAGHSFKLSRAGLSHLESEIQRIKRPGRNNGGSMKSWFVSRRYDVTKGVHFMQSAGWRVYGSVLVFGRFGLAFIWREKELKP